MYMGKNKIEDIGKFWQRNYYEHVIRNAYELKGIREYILDNPHKWDNDLENPESSINQEYLKNWGWLEGKTPG
jgi:putative transposase